MSDLFFTADTHINHKFILPYCGRTKFMNSSELAAYKQNPGERISISPDSLKAMDRELIDETNAVVGEDDILVHAGDVLFGSISQLRQWRDQIKCRHIYLVIGNHDKVVLENLSLPTRKPRGCFRIPAIGYVPGVFEAVFARTEIKWNGINISVNHYMGAIWNKSHHHSWSLYGHSHGGAEAWREEHLPEALTLDVGVDNIYKIYGRYSPVKFETLAELFKNKSSHVIDHHSSRR